MCRFAAAAKLTCSLNLFVIMMSGCGGSPDAFTGDRGQVSGIITVDGTPVPQGCEVMFISIKESYLATGVTTVGGKYTLKYRFKSGMPAVAYAVQLTPPAGNLSKGAADPMMASAAKVKKDQPVADDGPVPARYGSITTSNLKFTIEPGANIADFDLTKKSTSK